MPAKIRFYSFFMAFSILFLAACTSDSPAETKNEVAKEEAVGEVQK